MTTIVRRHPVPRSTVKEPVLLRFTTGKVVNPARCPRGIQAHAHWTIIDSVDEHGVNTTCACEVAP